MKLSSLPRALRTIRSMRPRQIVAQALRPLLSGSRPVAYTGAPPTLRSNRATVPFLPAPPHAKWSGDSLELINRSVAFADPIDWHPSGESPLFAFHLHQFDFARAPGLSPERRSKLLLDWIDRHPDGVGWKPHPISLRVLSWGKLLMTPGDLSLGEDDHGRVLRSLASQIETLDRNLEVRLQANHLFSNLLGVVFGGLLLESERSERWLRRADWLQREIEDQVLADGAHVERSPMYHSLLLENLLDLQNLISAQTDSPVAGLVQSARAASERMLGALALLTHPDGEIALFADSAFGIAHPPRCIFDYARQLGVEAPRTPSNGVLVDAGYVRLEESPFTLIASVGGPMPAHQPGHAHCDGLSFELSVGDERVISDSGVYEYVPGDRRSASRSVAGHATLEIADSEQSEVWASHRIGGRARVRLVDHDAPRSFEATCTGWFHPDSVHRRRVAISSREIVLEDSLEGESLSVTSRLPLAPGLTPQLEQAEDGSKVALIDLASGRVLQIELPTGLSWRVEAAPQFPEFGREVERACLVGESAAFVRGSYRISLR